MADNDNTMTEQDGESAAKPEVEQQDGESAAKPEVEQQGGAAAAKREAARQDQALLQSIYRALGEVVLLMGDMSDHRYYFYADARWSLLPPIALRQYKLFHNKQGETVGYVAWACVSDEVCGRLKDGAFRLRPNEWNSGEQVVVMEVAGPAAAGGKMLQALKKEVFPQRAVCVLERDAGSGAAVLREIQLPDNQDKQKETD